MDDVLRIDRASPGDLAMRSMGSRRVPEQFGAVLILDGANGFDLPAAKAMLAERVRTVPRFRQILVPVARWHGRPIWVDDEAFDAMRHIEHLARGDVVDERALLDIAADLVSQPLPDDRPLWRAVFVSGLAEGRVGLVIVVDHVVSDGVGGLAVLGRLVDGAPPIATDYLPRRRPTASELRSDAVRSWLRTAKATPGAIRGLAASLGSARRVRPGAAADCSLLISTGPKRRFEAARGDLEAIRVAAHRHGATINDAVLAAVAGAMRALLAHRGETVDEFIVSVPVSVRAATTTGALGNRINAMLVAVPAIGPSRLNTVAARTRIAKAAASAGVGSFAWLSGMFRIAAKLGLTRMYLTRQHIIHTVVSNVRGPRQTLCFAGLDVTDIIPISIGEAGNVTATFVAFSYGGRLTITVTADPEHLVDSSVLAEALRSELALLERAATAEAGH